MSNLPQNDLFEGIESESIGGEQPADNVQAEQEANEPAASSGGGNVRQFAPLPPPPVVTVTVAVHVAKPTVLVAMPV